MPTVLIIYNTKTGNTELMAKAVEEGVKIIKGVTVDLHYHATVAEFGAADGVVFGVPTYNHHMTLDIQRLLEEAAKKKLILTGKPAGSFGSFGWSGEAPHQVLEVLVNKFQMKSLGPPILAKYKPDEESLERCRELGQNVAKAVL